MEEKIPETKEQRHDVVLKHASVMAKEAHIEASKNNACVKIAEIPRSAGIAMYADYGVDEAMLKKVTRANADVHQAVHFAASQINIDNIKETVKAGKDWRECDTHASMHINRSHIFSAKADGYKAGSITRPDGTTMDYEKVNSVTSQFCVSGGISKEISDEHTNRVHEIIKDSPYPLKK